MHYLEATWSSRAKFVAAMAALPAWVWSHQLWLPALLSRLRTESPCDNLGTSQFFWAYFFILTCLPAAFAFFRARQIHLVGQVPLPGAWLLVRRRVLTGRWVRFNVMALVAAGLALLAVPAIYWRETGGLVLFFAHGC